MQPSRPRRPSRNDQSAQRHADPERSSPSIPETATGDGDGSGSRFPIVLHQLLADSERRQERSIVSWSACGTMMKVHDKERFSKEVMPRWFRQGLYKSFQRNLNLYNFQRHKDGEHRGYYRHAFFVRGNVDLCERIQRKSQRSHRNTSSSALPQLSIPSSLWPNTDQQPPSRTRQDERTTASSLLSQSSLELLRPLEEPANRGTAPSSLSQPVASRGLIDHLLNTTRKRKDIVVGKVRKDKKDYPSPAILDANDPCAKPTSAAHQASQTLLSSGIMHPTASETDALDPLLSSVTTTPPTGRRRTMTSARRNTTDYVSHLFPPEEANRIMLPSLIDNTAMSLTQEMQDELIRMFQADEHDDIM